MTTVTLQLRGPGLSAVNDLCAYLLRLQRQGEIADWHFCRHTDRARTLMPVEFASERDAEYAARGWRDTRLSNRREI